MRGWLKDASGDMALTAGDSTIVEGDVATAQELRSRLLLFKGSFFADLREGVPWFQEILRKGYSTARVRQILRDTLLSHPEVVDVPTLTLTVDPVTRAGTVTFEARTLAGSTIRSEDFGPVLVA